MKECLYKCKAMCMILLILQTGKTAGTIGVAILLNFLIDTVSVAINSGKTEALLQCGIICVLYAVCLGIIIFLFEQCKAKTIKKVMINMRKNTMAGILNKSISEFQSDNSARYLTLLNQNMSSLEEQYWKNMLGVYADAISILLGIVLLVCINPLIAVISIILMAIPSMIPKIFGKALANRQKNITEYTKEYLAKLKDILNGFEVIQSYGIAKQMEMKHFEATDNMEESKVELAKEMAWVYGLANMLSVAVQFLVMSLAGFFAVKGIVSIGSIVAITQLTGQVISPAFQLSTKFAQIKSTQPIREQILCLSVKGREEKEKADVKELQRKIELKDVCFSYENKPVLHHIDAKFERGKKYVIVGKSGSGKSTLLKLIAGYYGKCDEIVVDDSCDLCSDMTMISQNVFLFDDTIRNNITLYGTYDENEIEEAVRIAGLEDMVKELEQGLDTCVEENGARFSGGEKQRIAIARALLYKKNLLLIDEATSALDNENARKVEQNILDLENMTCISVTHKLMESMMQQYDEILVMDNGELVEKGTFYELMQTGQKFRTLCG